MLPSSHQMEFHHLQLLLFQHIFLELIHIHVLLFLQILLLCRILVYPHIFHLLFFPVLLPAHKMCPVSRRFNRRLFFISRLQLLFVFFLFICWRNFFVCLFIAKSPSIYKLLFYGSPLASFVVIWPDVFAPVTLFSSLKYSAKNLQSLSAYLACSQ